MGSGAILVVGGEVTAFKGYEQHTLTTQCATYGGILGGHFALEIPYNAAASDLKLELETIASLGTAKVIRRAVHGSINVSQWTIVLIYPPSNVPLLDVHDQLTCSDGSESPLIFITETVQGLLPRMLR